MNIFLDMVGCRLNQSEIETYARQLLGAGHTLVSSCEAADIVVINTCSVTEAAASDSRQKIHQANRGGAREIVVTGCWADLNPEHAKNIPGGSRVVPNSLKDHLISDLISINMDKVDLETLERHPLPGARLRTRAFIKVQDGCDNHCTFCVARVARGSAHSRTVAEVIKDIQVSGAKEIVLTGVHLGAWGKDFSPSMHLKDLITAVLEQTQVPRVRLSSLEPWDLDSSFFSLWENNRLCRHLHLPIQSGCDTTLRRMARRITTAEYGFLLAEARAIIPNVAITTDLIAGFPGESDGEFLETLHWVESMQFANGHVFTFSPRPGTAATRMPDHVPFSIRKARNTRLRTLLTEAAISFRKRYVGQTLPVLWEHTNIFSAGNWHLSGLTDNYIRVNAAVPERLWNTITSVKVTGTTRDGLCGVASNEG